MMFKDIPMHTKLLKHAKYIEILRHSLKKHDFRKKLSYCLNMAQKYLRYEAHTLHARFSISFL